MNGVNQRVSLLNPAKQGIDLAPVLITTDKLPAVDEDDDSVESLPSLQTTVSSSHQSVNNESSTALFSVFESIQAKNSNPLNLLLEFYSKQQEQPRDPPHTCFREEGPLALQNEGGITRQYFRCHFQCPLTGIKVSSSIPAILFGTSTDDEIAAATRDFFAADYTIFEGNVYFEKKKAAKKSCALVALVHIDPAFCFGLAARLASSSDDAGDDDDNDDGKLNINASNSLAETSPPLKLAGSPSKKRVRKKSKAYPEWVNRLFRAGIQSISISYREHERVQRDLNEYKMSPTLIFCEIAVRQPFTVSVCGEPFASKKKALQSAVNRLLEEEFEPPTLSQTNEWDIKQDLFASNPSDIFLYTTLPTWASTSFSLAPQAVYLYELVLSTPSGQSWAAERMGLSSSSGTFDGVTRIGIIFPQDILAASDTAASDHFCFCSKFFEQTCEAEVTAELRSRTVIEVTRKNVQTLLDLNCFLRHWKQYGMGRSRSKVQGHISHLPQWGNGGRTYLFAPLCHATAKVEVDWNCISQALNGDALPILESSYACTSFPLVRSVDLRLLAAIVVLLFMGLLGQDHLPAVFGLFFATSVAIAIPWLGPRKLVSLKGLSNRFLQHRDQRFVYVCSSREEAQYLTARSPLQSVMTNEDSEKHQVLLKSKRKVDLTMTTLVDFSRKRWGRQIYYPDEQLVHARRVQQHTNHNPFAATKLRQNNNFVYLVPEFTTYLSLRRDFVYVVDQAKRYMPCLEREIEDRRLALSLSREIEPTTSGVSIFHERMDIESLIYWFKRANKLHHRGSSERLEFLGDSVLGFFIAVQATMRETPMWIPPADMEHAMQASASNDCLAEASLRISLHHLLDWQPTPFCSAYRPISHNDSESGFIAKMATLPTSLLSDGFESVLGAVFLVNGMSSLSLIRNARIPLFAEKIGHSFRDLPSSFLEEGLLQDVDGVWKARMDCADTILKNHAAVLLKLEKGIEALGRALDASCLSIKASDKLSGCPHTLILCALFDDSLTELEEWRGPSYPRKKDETDTKLGSSENADEFKSENPANDDLLQLAFIREMLFQVGAFALQLMVTSELFKRNASASVGDLMLLRSSIINSDTMSYLMTKNLLHQSLFDQGTHYEFIDIAREADARGSALWEQKGGWIVPEGPSEFRRRTQIVSDSPDSLPRYSGLKGGLLCGHIKKLPASVTGDLVFSFKAIIGALTLTLGAKEMWVCLRPIFLETMVLTADEIRRESGSSTIANTYGSGKGTGKA